MLIYTYRITNKTNTIPIITATQAPTVPPTIAGKLSDKDKSIVVVSKKNEITKYWTLCKVICMLSLSNVIETLTIYVIYKEYLSEVHPNQKYTISTLVSIFTTIQTAAIGSVTRLVDTVNITLILTCLFKRLITC